MPNRISGAILWRGPSEIDGSPIALIVTGLGRSSKNAKTGAMLQTWIIRTDMDPIAASNSGADAAICGDCKHRGEVVAGKVRRRTCYVTLMHAPLNVYRTMRRGRYPDMTPEEFHAMRGDRPVRAGSYGDPAAVPVHVWRPILAPVKIRTGYSHAWKYCDQALAEFVMASVDSELEREWAAAKGWRTFRVMRPGETYGALERACPASAEAGKKVSCVDCKACAGLSTPYDRQDRAIYAHGNGAGNFA